MEHSTEDHTKAATNCVTLEGKANSKKGGLGPKITPL